MEEKKELWMVQTKRADFSGLAMRLGVSPVAVRVMRNRGLTEEAEMRKYLYGTLDDLYDPRLMKGMEQAAELIVRKLKEGKHVRIIGDYDIDGVCSTYILLKGFQRAAKELSQRCSLEAGRYSVEKENDAQIDYEIPDRIKDGYGINESIIRQASADGVDTLVTCDNGIAALREISIAKQLGMTVVVTDHHEVPVDEEKFLFQPGVGNDGQAGFLAEQPEDAAGLFVEGLIGTQKRGLAVERHARPRQEGRGNAQDDAAAVLHEIGGAGDVPRGIAARLEGASQAAGGEAGAVGFALTQHLAAEFRDHAAVAVGRQEPVVLFGGVAGQGIEDMGEMGRALFDGPVLHGGSHDVRQRRIELHPLFDGLAQGFVDDPRQALLHHLVAEHVAAVDFGRLGVGVIQGGEVRLVAGDGSDGIAAGIASAHASILLGENCGFNGMGAYTPSAGLTEGATLPFSSRY